MKIFKRRSSPLQNLRDLEDEDDSYTLRSIPMISRNTSFWFLAVLLGLLLRSPV